MFSQTLCRAVSIASDPLILDQQVVNGFLVSEDIYEVILMHFIAASTHSATSKSLSPEPGFARFDLLSVGRGFD